MSLISTATTAYSQLNLTTQKTVLERVATDKGETKGDAFLLHN